MTLDPKRRPKIRSVAVAQNTLSLLPGADFADAFQCVIVDDPSLDAGEATRRALAYTPAWIAALMAVRDLIVAPLGLKTRRNATPSDVVRVGAFPLISQTPERVVLGFNDKHQDFRIVVDVVAPDDRQPTVTLTTLVRTHNLFGRSYLAVVMPFHRAIVPAMLAQISHRQQ